MGQASKTLPVIVVVAVCLSARTLAQDQDPPNPSSCQPYGTVTIHGGPAPDSTAVVATINGVVYARGYTQGGNYVLLIAKDDSQTPQKEGWESGDLVFISVNGNLAYPSFEAFAGAQQKDLTVAAAAVKLTTWGKIKAIFK